MSVLPGLELLRRIGFGALLGAGLGGLLYATHPALFPGAAFREVIYIGAAIGGGLSQLIEKGMHVVLNPVSRRAKHYSKILELAIARSHGIVTEEQAQAIREQLQADYFLGDTRIPVKRGLPP